MAWLCSFVAKQESFFCNLLWHFYIIDNLFLTFLLAIRSFLLRLASYLLGFRSFLLAVPTFLLRIRSFLLRFPASKLKTGSFEAGFGCAMVWLFCFPWQICFPESVCSDPHKWFLLRNLRILPPISHCHSSRVPAHRLRAL